MLRHGRVLLRDGSRRAPPASRDAAAPGRSGPGGPRGAAGGAVALLSALALAAFTGGCGDRPTPPVLRISGSTTVNRVVARAADVLRAQRDMEIRVDTQGGSSGGIAALGDGRADVAMSSRRVEDHDREKYPDVDFRTHRVGVDGVALVVHRGVADGGVEALSREEVRRLYEKEVRNWRALGGPDLRIVLYDKEPGRGTWEVFADWLYGDASRVPRVTHPRIGSNEEGRSKVRSTPGAATQLSAAWAGGEDVVALSLETAAGEVVPPTDENLSTGRYPMARPLLLVTDGDPSPAAREVIEFLRGREGQELVREAGYVPLSALDGAASEGEAR